MVNISKIRPLVWLLWALAGYYCYVILRFGLFVAEHPDAFYYNFLLKPNLMSIFWLLSTLVGLYLYITAGRRIHKDTITDKQIRLFQIISGFLAGQCTEICWIFLVDYGEGLSLSSGSFISLAVQCVALCCILFAGLSVSKLRRANGSYKMVFLSFAASSIFYALWVFWGAAAIGSLSWQALLCIIGGGTLFYFFPREMTLVVSVFVAVFVAIAELASNIVGGIMRK